LPTKTYERVFEFVQVIIRNIVSLRVFEFVQVIIRNIVSFFTLDTVKMAFSMTS